MMLLYEAEQRTMAPSDVIDAQVMPPDDMAAELVHGVETNRAELERMNKMPLPSRTTIEATLAKEPGLRGCGGEPACLGALARKLDAEQIVAGNVAQLGDSYVVNLKLVDATCRRRSRAAPTI